MYTDHLRFHECSYITGPINNHAFCVNSVVTLLFRSISTIFCVSVLFTRTNLDQKECIVVLLHRDLSSMQVFFLVVFLYQQNVWLLEKKPGIPVNS